MTLWRSVAQRWEGIPVGHHYLGTVVMAAFVMMIVTFRILMVAMLMMMVALLVVKVAGQDQNISDPVVKNNWPWGRPCLTYFRTFQTTFKVRHGRPKSPVVKNNWPWGPYGQEP